MTSNRQLGPITEGVGVIKEGIGTVNEIIGGVRQGLESVLGIFNIFKDGFQGIYDMLKTAKDIIELLGFDKKDDVLLFDKVSTWSDIFKLLLILSSLDLQNMRILDEVLEFLEMAFLG